MLIISTVFLTFIAYLTIALPLAVLPAFVHDRLGYGSVMAGAAVSLQYVATILSRARVGHLADTAGPKRAVQVGLVACAGGGVLMVVAGMMAARPVGSLVPLLASRLALGIGESLVGTGAIAWAIRQTGPHHTARIISWNGVATFGALAAGAPLGVVADRVFGFGALGVGVIGLGVMGLVLAAPRASSAPRPERRLGFRHVLARVLPCGLVLALAATGFGTLATFVTLYYGGHGWDGAAFCLTVFGVAFMVTRLLFHGTINRYGGVRVATLSLVIVTGGLLVLWRAGMPAVALGGAALTGAGFALVFPSLGVIAVGLVPPANRGAALGVYSVFLDLALGVSGPLAGLVATWFGTAVPFLAGACATLVALILTTRLSPYGGIHTLR